MICIIKKRTPSRQSIYYRNNKERIKKYQKEYNDTRRSKERMTCPCGKSFFVRNQDRHEASLRHRKFIYMNTKQPHHV